MQHRRLRLRWTPQKRRFSTNNTDRRDGSMNECEMSLIGRKNPQKTLLWPPTAAFFSPCNTTVLECPGSGALPWTLTDARLLDAAWRAT
jgi:hypothetical protein